MINVFRSLIPKNNICVAVSGGVDSIACLHLLHRIYKSKVHACHVNHKYQPVNDGMMASVQRFCSDFNIPLTIAAREDSNPITKNVEAGLRDFRLSVFKKLQMDVVLCHHLNDAVESYLMNTFKGCPEYKPIQEITELEGTSFKMIRPFLRTSKVDIQRYAENNDLMKYVVEDPSNSDNRFMRNRVRNQIIPMIHDLGLEKIVSKKFYNNINNTLS